MNDLTRQHDYDLAVIGSGPGGYESALEAARLGMKTALIERDALGGTCLNRGCIPTKTFLHWAETYGQACRLPGLSSALSQSAPADFMADLMEHKDQVVSRLRDGLASLLKSAKVEVIQGQASILAPGQIRVQNGQERIITAGRILISTGSLPSVPPIPGHDLPGVLTSDGLLSLKEPIHSLTIIGGGVIGMEFASIFSSLGCSVAVIESMDRILPSMDREFSQNLRIIMKKRGVRIEAGATVEEILPLPDGSLNCRFRQKEAQMEIASEKILIATGRKAFTQGLIDPQADSQVKSMAMNRGFIQVNSRFETSVPGICAIGDVIGSIQLAHAAAAQGKWAVSKGVSNQSHSLPDLNFIPSCVYTDPEIASVGLTADEAKAKGMDIKTLKYPMSANGRSVLTGQERGFIKVTVSRETGQILGAQMMCARAGDLISFFTEALTNGLTAWDLQKVIFPHPTFSEGISETLKLYP